MLSVPSIALVIYEILCIGARKRFFQLQSTGEGLRLIWERCHSLCLNSRREIGCVNSYLVRVGPEKSTTPRQTREQNPPRVGLSLHVTCIFFLLKGVESIFSVIRRAPKKGKRSIPASLSFTLRE